MDLETSKPAGMSSYDARLAPGRAGGSRRIDRAGPHRPGARPASRPRSASSAAACPAAATILSDFGAEVIKIEPPGAGDPWRASPAVPGKTTDYWWQLTARNKQSLAIDLKHPEGLGVLHRLVGSTDVFITNFPLPVRER